MVKKGIFITFEGGEGSGKSSQLELLRLNLLSKGYNVTALREPGGTPIGEEIRHTLKHSKNGVKMTPETELLLINASRAQIVREKIRPALDKGEIVLCDRFYDSTIAYQGYGRGLDLDQVANTINLATGGLEPDLTFLINVSVEQGLENAKSRNADLPFKEEYDRLDAQELIFHQKVYQGFQDIASRESDRVVVISYKHKDIDGTSREILDHVLEYLSQNPHLYLENQKLATKRL